MLWNVISWKVPPLGSFKLLSGGLFSSRWIIHQFTTSNHGAVFEANYSNHKHADEYSGDLERWHMQIFTTELLCFAHTRPAGVSSVKKVYFESKSFSSKSLSRHHYKLLAPANTLVCSGFDESVLALPLLNIQWEHRAKRSNSVKPSWSKGKKIREWWCHAVVLQLLSSKTSVSNEPLITEFTFLTVKTLKCFGEHKNLRLGLGLCNLLK